MSEILQPTAHVDLSLRPICSEAVTASTDFLPQVVPAIRAVAGRPDYILHYGVLLARKGAIEHDTLIEQARGIFPDGWHGRPVERKHIRSHLVNPGLVSMREMEWNGRRWVPETYTPLPAARHAAGVLGVLTRGQLEDLDMPISALLGARTATQGALETGDVYGQRAMVRLSILQKMLGAQALTGEDIKKCLPQITDTRINSSLDTLRDIGIIDRMHKHEAIDAGLLPEEYFEGRSPIARAYYIRPPARPTVSMLLRRFCSLRSPAFREAAITALQQAQHDPDSAQRFAAAASRQLHGKPYDAEARAAKSTPPWLVTLIDAMPDWSVQQKSERAAQIEQLFKIGALTDAPAANGGNVGLDFTEATKTHFGAMPQALRAIARYYGLEQRMYGATWPQDTFERLLPLNGMPWRHYVETDILPQLRYALSSKRELTAGSSS